MQGLSDAVGAAVAADGRIDMIEFLRLYAWVDIESIADAVKESLLRKGQTGISVMKRLKGESPTGERYGIVSLATHLPSRR